MRQRAWRFTALAAAAALVAAVPALADDDREHRGHPSCDSGCGWTIEASGPTFCGPNKQDTCIKYTLTGEGTPDHFGVYLSVDLDVVTTSPGAQVVDLCRSGDAAMKVAPNCHERLLRFDRAKGPFWVQVKGQHEKAPTTAVIKKGYQQCGKEIDGIGFTPAPPQQTACVNNCGNFDPHQQRKSVETFRFKGCQLTFSYGDDGSVEDFQTCTLDESGKFCVDSLRINSSVDTAPGVCQARTGLIGELNLYGGPTENNTKGAFGDGWLNTGDNSCATRLIGGRYYTVCY